MHYGKSMSIFFFLVSYVGERPWWPVQSPNKGRKNKLKDGEGEKMRKTCGLWQGKQVLRCILS